MNRKSVTRRTVLASGAALSAGALAACGTSTGQTTQNTGAPAATKPTGNIEFWHNWSTRAPQLRVYLDQFEQQHPGTKVLDQDATQFGGRAKMTAGIIAGTMPDSLMVFKDMYPLVVPAKAVMGLNKYVSRDKIDLKQFADGDVKERTFSGELVALPSASGGSGSGTLLYWNKAHFKQVGINPDLGPRTWSDLEEYVSKLNRTGERLGVNPTGVFLSWLFTNNGKLYADADGKTVGFDSPEGRDALRYVTGLVQRQGGTEVLQTLGADSRNKFFQGQHSMLLHPDLLPSLAANDPAGKEVEWGVGLLPHNQANSRAKFQTASRGGHGYGVSSQAKNPEGAWALAKFLTLSDAQCDFMTKVQGRVSTLKRCNTAPDMQKRSEFQVFSKMLDGVVSQPFSPGDDKAVAALEKHATSAALGQTGVDVAIVTAVREAQNELDEAWKQWRS